MVREIILLISKGEALEKTVKFEVKGKVETLDTNGIYESLNDKTNPLVYLRNTKLTVTERKNNKLSKFSCK